MPSPGPPALLPVLLRLQRRFEFGLINREFRRERLCQNHAGSAQVPVDCTQLCCLSRCVDPGAYRFSARADVERGELRSAVADHRHAVGFEDLQRAAEYRGCFWPRRTPPR